MPKIQYYESFNKYQEPFTEWHEVTIKDGVSQYMPCQKCQQKGGFHITPAILADKLLHKEEHVISCKNKDCDNTFIMKILSQE